MGTYREIDGNLIYLSREGIFDVVTHGCNCLCQMGAGIAPQMANEFGCKALLSGTKRRGLISFANDGT